MRLNSDKTYRKRFTAMMRLKPIFFSFTINNHHHQFLRRDAMEEKKSNIFLRFQQIILQFILLNLIKT